MLTFITLSRQPDNVRNLQMTIRLALGPSRDDPGFSETGAWQLLAIDGTQHDIFRGYNLGAQQAQGEILVFVHDDVLILGNNLTFQKPLALLADPATGFIGVAGSRTMSDKCLGWWNEHFAASRGMAAHPLPGEFGIQWNIWPWSSEQNVPCVAAQFGRVAVLDGVFLMCHRRTFERVGGFDEQTFKGFHFYDMDITLRAALLGLNNYAAPIPIFHASGGAAFQGDWNETRRLFIEKFKDVLPWTIS